MRHCEHCLIVHYSLDEGFHKSNPNFIETSCGGIKLKATTRFWCKTHRAIGFKKVWKENGGVDKQAETRWLRLKRRFNIGGAYA